MNFKAQLTCVAMAMATLAGSALAQTATTKPSSREYTIKLQRPCKVGDRFVYVARGTFKSSSVTKADGKEVRNASDSYNAELIGTLEVTAVGQRGTITGVSFTVQKCAMDRGGTISTLLNEGLVILGKTEGTQQLFQIKDNPQVQLSKETYYVLGQLIELEKGAYTDDDLMGTNKPQKVGSAWAINSEASAKSLAEQNLAVKPEDFTGTIKVTGTKTIRGTECLTLAGQVEAKNVTPPLPPGSRVDKCTLKATIYGAFPVDPSIYRLDGLEVRTVESAFRLPASDGKTILEVTNNISTTISKELAPTK